MTEIEKELKRFIASGKATKKDYSGGFLTTYIDPLKIAKHFAQWQKKQIIKELKPDFSGMIIHNYLKDCWQFCDGEIPTDKCINPDYINVEVFITSKK